MWGRGHWKANISEGGGGKKSIFFQYADAAALHQDKVWNSLVEKVRRVWLNKCHFWTLLQGGCWKVMKRMKRYIPKNLTHCLTVSWAWLEGLADALRLRSQLSTGNYKKEARWVLLSNVTVFNKRKSHYGPCCAAGQQRHCLWWLWGLFVIKRSQTWSTYGMVQIATMN